MAEIKCIIIEDEFPAMKLLEKFVKETHGVILLNSFQDPRNGISFLKKEKVDLVFLDINMPNITGLEIAAAIQSGPQIIFTTAYSEYGAESYNYGATDYLLKPIPYDRFLKAIERAKEKFLSNNKDSKAKMTIKSGYDLVTIYLDKVVYIEGMKEYVAFHTMGKRVLTYRALKELEEELSNKGFLRIHRSYIVNEKFIRSITSNKVITEKAELPLSKGRAKYVREKFIGKI